MVKKGFQIILLLMVLGLLAFFFAAGKIIDQQFNVLIKSDHGVPDNSLLRFHQTLQIADWHADNLLWDRNPLVRTDHGHIDIPRLIEGNFTLQVFDAVIKTPRNMNYISNTGDTDNVTPLAIANRWPIKTWTSLYERAIYQSQRLYRAAERSEGRLRVITSRGDLKALLDLKEDPQVEVVGGMLSIEGLHALEGQLSNLEGLYNAGYRMMGLVHFFDNAVGGSSAGVDKGGLTPLGRQVVQKMNELGIIIDLAHASQQLIDDVLALSTQPCVVSHTGVVGTYESPRNLTDRHLDNIAAAGGMIGIGFWDGAVGSPLPRDIVKAMRYAVDRIGIDHVCLGSDWDGGTRTYFDAAHIWVLTRELKSSGFSEEEIRKIMGVNQIEFLLRELPK